MHRTVIGGPTRNPQNVWETGVGCEKDDNCVLRVKEVDTLYRREAPTATEPAATEAMAIEPEVERKKSKKRRKGGDEKQPAWKRKVVRTITKSGEEQETISMYLRKADIVIDVSIKSPAKRKGASRRISTAADGVESSVREKGHSLQCSSTTAAHTKIVKSTSSRPEADAGAIIPQAEDVRRKGKMKEKDTTRQVSSGVRLKSADFGPRRCLRESFATVPVSNTVNAGDEGLQTLAPEAPAMDTAPAVESCKQAEVPFSFPNVDVGTVAGEISDCQENANSATKGDEEVQDLPTVAENRDGSEVVRSQEPLWRSNSQELSLSPQTRSKNLEARVTTAEVSPPAEVTSPPAKSTLKPCQLTVAACLESLKTARERSRSPSPLPHTPPQTGTPTRPPRPIGPRVTVSPRRSQSVHDPEVKVLKLIPHPFTESEKLGTDKAGMSQQELTKNLDNILSQLPAEVQAKYLKSKSVMLEENHGGSAVDKGQTISGVELRKEVSKSKENRTVIESSPPNHVESSKKEERKQKREAKKRQKVVVIEKAMRELEQQKALLVGGKKKKGQVAVPSPRESGKGQPSKRAVGTTELLKGIKVSHSKGGKKKTPDSVDSSAPSLHTEGNVISDPHAIGIWDVVKDVPPCEVNSEGAPIGRFWEHMQSYLHDRAPWLFEWDIPWPQQSKEMKRAFANRVRLMYPGKYEMEYVLENVATNIRQRRQRTRNHMKKNKCKKFTPIAHGLTVKSWNNIWASISNPNYQDKSNKCKVAADARTDRMGYTHRLGAMGVAGLMKKFEEEFHRLPTDEEVAIGKREGVRGLFDIIRNRYKKKPEVLEDVRRNPKPQQQKKKKRPVQDESEGSDEDSARTTSDEEEEGAALEESGDSSSSGSDESSSRCSDDDEGEDEDMEVKDPKYDDEEDEQARDDDGNSSDEGSSDNAD